MDLPTLIVGKAGVSDEFVAELRARLAKSRRVRVRFLRSARAGSGRAALADEILSKVSFARLEDARGNTIILAKA